MQSTVTSLNKTPYLSSPSWLNNNLDKVVPVDASWYMPNSPRNGKEEYKAKRIKVSSI
ncbi:hypothetical protein K502DRAFT_347033, partial [Neoconidiobolus thromboides FSU 785]